MIEKPMLTEVNHRPDDLGVEGNEYSMGNNCYYLNLDEYGTFY